MSVPLIKTVGDSYRFVIKNLNGIFVQAIPIFVVNIFLFWTSQKNPFNFDADDNQNIIGYILMILAAPVAISVHRSIILAESYDSRFLRNFLSMRCLKFSGLIFFPSVLMDLMLFLSKDFPILGLIFIVILIYLSVRLSAAFPLIAIDENQPIKATVYYTKNSFWKILQLAMGVVVPPSIFYGVCVKMFGKQEITGGLFDIPMWQPAILITYSVWYIFVFTISAAIISFFMKNRIEEKAEKAVKLKVQAELSNDA